jgi:O-acetylserine/cysteine efflux transporter
MSPRDILAAVSVAVVWGLTFIAIKVGVGETSPLTLSALRFIFAAFPFVFFISPPKAPAWKAAVYGLLLGVGQFGFLFIAIHQGFPVGLASLVVQAQAFFTVALAWLFLSESPRRMQVVGGLVAFAGLAVIGSARVAGATLWPFLLVALASFFWGSANVLAKTAGKVDMLAFTVWSSLGCSPSRSQSTALGRCWRSPIRVGGSSSACWSSPTPGRCLASASWARLLTHYSAATVAPFALLTPVVGMIAGSAVFGEPSRPVELFGAVLVLAGLALNVFGDWMLRRREAVLR